MPVLQNIIKIYPGIDKQETESEALTSFVLGPWFFFLNPVFPTVGRVFNK